MADQDTTVKVENGEKVEDEVETTQVEDDATTTGTEEDQTDTGKENEEEDSTEGEESEKDTTQTEEETKADFQKRFSQFEGDTIEEYLKKLEDAYANSSTEGQRNAKEAKEAKERYDKVAALVANDPEFAKKLEDNEEAPKPPVDPAIEYARQQMEQEYQSQWGDFVKMHPEVADDKNLQTELIDELDVIGAAYESRGKALSMAEGLRKAWISLGKDNADNKEKVVTKAKEEASKTTPTAKAKTSSDKAVFTPEQIAVAKKMGLTPEQLAKYNKK